MPIQLAHYWFPGLAIENLYFTRMNIPGSKTVLEYKYTIPIIYTEAILSNSTRELLWFEITKMPIAVLKTINLLCHLL